MSAAHATASEATPDRDDTRLARRWQDGDAAAGSELIDRHLPQLRAFLAARCGSPIEADDLAQEVFLAVCRSLAAYDSQLPFTGWLYGIARKKLAGFWRQNQPTGPVEFAREPVEPVSPADTYEQMDSAAHLWKEVFARLPEAQASALWLRVQEDLSVEDIARTLEISLPNAKVLLFRARQTLTPFFKHRLHAV